MSEEYGSRSNSMYTVAFVFLIIACVVYGWALIPLAWLIPMTIKVSKAKNDPSVEVGTGFKVCVLLFANLIAGICLLAGDKD